jgi:hypothetical protein
MNPLSQMMGGGINPQAVQQVRKMMTMMRAMSNPQQAIAQMAGQNPQINTIMQMCQGKDPKDVFYAECEKRGVDPESILSQLR